jgi:hypothetical protein
MVPGIHAHDIDDFARQGAAGYQEHPILSRRLG